MREVSIDEIIDFISKTNEDSWCTNRVRTKDGKNCFFGHLFSMFSNDREASYNWDMFEEIWATTYMIYPVNDGEDERYKQPTPKQRVLQYLKDLRDGKEKSSYELMKEYEETFDKKKKANIMKS